METHAHEGAPPKGPEIWCHMEMTKSVKNMFDTFEVIFFFLLQKARAETPQTTENAFWG